MIILCFVLTGVSVWLEWRLVHSLAIFGWWFENKTRALIGSIMLSFAVGTLFGAAGVIVFIAGLFSTFIIQPLYAAEKAGALSGYHKRKTEVIDTFYTNKSEIARHATQLESGVRLALRVTILWPIKGLFKAIDMVDSSTRKAK